MQRTWLTIIGSLLVIVTHAQSRQTNEVAAAVEQLRVAMIDADTKRLEDLVAADLSYGHSSGLVENKKDFIKRLENGQSDFVTITLTEQTVRVANKIAVVRHTFQATTNDAGKHGEVRLNILLVWQKRSGSWKLLARQAVKIP